MIRTTDELLYEFFAARVDAMIDHPGDSPDRHALQAVLNIVEPEIRANMLDEINELATDLPRLVEFLDNQTEDLPGASRARTLLRLLAATDGPLALPPTTTPAQANP